MPHPLIPPGSLATVLRSLNARLAGSDEAARAGARGRADMLFGASERLIVYGSLAPGRTNHHEVAHLGGEWTAGWITGNRVQTGWGAGLGYPAIRWRPAGERVPAWLLRSAGLEAEWARLDAFEGPAYQRLLAPFETENGVTAVGYVYAAAPGTEDGGVNLQRLRSETPGCEECIHLNNAGAALMPEPVLRTLQDHITLESRIGGYEAAAARQDAVRAAYRSVAELIGTRPENIAFTENATASCMQALSSIPFERGDVILTTRNDYVSSQIQFLSLQARMGVRVLRAPDRTEGGVDVQAMADLIRRHRPRLVCVTQVPTNSGLVQDVAAVGSVCRDEEILYLVDACQSIGQMPVDVHELQCDFLAASSRKYLRGPRGAGFLYVSDRVLQRGLAPLFIDMRGADWIAPDQYRAVREAKRFENWEFAWALVLATGEAARYAMAVGLEEIRNRVGTLAERLRQELGAMDKVRVLDRGTELCGIVSAGIDGRDPGELVVALRQRRINTSAQIRVYAVIDYNGKGVTASLRVSPHYYNTEEEIDQTVAAVRELLLERV